MKATLALLFALLTSPLFSQMPNTLSKAEKVYGLSKFWQEVNYNFVFLDKVDRTKWDEYYKRLITEVQETENDYEYYRLLQRFCASLKDGHTNVYFPEAIREQLFNTYFGEYRLFMTNINGKAVVTRVNESKKKEIPIGSEVVAVNGLTTKEYLEKNVHPYISSSTDYIVEDWGVNRMFKAPVGTRFDIRLKLPNGQEKELSLTHSETTEKAVYPPFEDWELMEFKWVKKDIAYVALNSFSDPKIDSLFIAKLPELYKAKKLIIDLRYNGGGSTGIGLEIMQYLTHDTILYGSKMQSRLHIPTYKAWGKWAKEQDTAGSDWDRKAFLSYRDQFYYNFDYEADTIRLDSQRLVVPTVLLIGHNTASAAEDFLIYADNQKHMTKMGEPSFGSTGQPMDFDLPGGGSARICTKKDTYPDGREFVGYGIQPDITVVKTLDDYLKNRDPVLEKAIEHLQGKK